MVVQLAAMYTGCKVNGIIIKCIWSCQRVKQDARSMELHGYDRVRELNKLQDLLNVMDMVVSQS